MKWFVSREIDTEDEVQYRIRFYAKLTGKEIVLENNVNAGYILSNRHDDNRCMIIGHTNTVWSVLNYLRAKSSKRYSLYICSCAMSEKELKTQIASFGNASSVRLAIQDIIQVRELSTKYLDGVVACEFVDKNYTRLGFKATRSELNMYNSPLKSFYSKLDSCFNIL
jgi:hypothetical protein